MKYLLILMIALASCSDTTPDSGCTKDSDCREGRACENRQCVNQNVSPSPTKKICGEVDISCNCATNTYYPGTIVSTSLCESGKHQFFVCSGYCYGGGSPWGAVCYCN